MGAYYTNELYYNLKVHDQSDGEDYEEFSAGGYDYIYTTILTFTIIPVFLSLFRYNFFFMCCHCTYIM